MHPDFIGISENLIINTNRMLPLFKNFFICFKIKLTAFICVRTIDNCQQKLFHFAQDLIIKFLLFTIYSLLLTSTISLTSYCEEKNYRKCCSSHCHYWFKNS